jgi:hypothetical protein
LEILVIATLLGQSSSSSSGDAAAFLFLIVYVVFVLAVLAFKIFVLLDILKHSDAAWQASGQNKVLWIVLWVFCCGGIVFDLIYWFAIRPKVLAAESGPGAPGGYPNYPG